MKKKILSFALILLMVFTITGCDSSSYNDDNYSNNNSNSNFSNSNFSNSTETKNQETKELTESEKMIVKISALFDEKLAFDTGSYIQGDIPAGEYAFIKFSGSGSYYCEKDGAGNIIDNENFDSFGYVKVHSVGNLETSGVLINVSAFEKLGVKSAKEIYEILNDQSNWNQGGYYKVGVDIAPGRYIVESIGSGYWSIMTGPVSASEIVDNDNFNGRATINLSNGQYLNLSRATISKAE